MLYNLPHLSQVTPILSSLAKLSCRFCFDLQYEQVVTSVVCIVRRTIDLYIVRFCVRLLYKHLYVCLSYKVFVMICFNPPIAEFVWRSRSAPFHICLSHFVAFEYCLFFGAICVDDCFITVAFLEHAILVYRF